VKPHPWANVLGKKATFETEPERIPETHTAEAVTAELNYLAQGTGYKVKQVHIEVDPATGHRIARGLLSRR
jgi:NaMN:DMB phosphoribosyltransferase